MPARTKLTMYEEILLLALDDEKGTTGMSGMHDLAMGGAILAELMLLGAMHIDDDKKKLASAEPGAQVADPLLAECLALVQQAKRRKRGADWVQKFAGLKNLKNRVARGLVTKGVLNESHDKVLGLFTRTIFPARDGGPEQDLIARLNEAVLTDTERLEPRTVIVTTLAQATSLLERAIPKKQLKPRKARLKQLAEGQVAAGATAAAIAAVQATQTAVMVAIIAASAASSASS